MFDFYDLKETVKDVAVIGGAVLGVLSVLGSDDLDSSDSSFSWIDRVATDRIGNVLPTHFLD